MDTKLIIPRVTASATAMFFQNENPKEAALHEIQYDNLNYLWKSIIRRADFRAAQYQTPNGSQRILHPSTQRGIDWQLSYIHPDGVPSMHSSYQEGGDSSPSQGHSMEDLFRDLSNDNARIEKEVTILLDDITKKGVQKVDERTSSFIADIAKLYAVNNRIPITPESDLFRALERANGTVDQAEYQRILTDTLMRGEQPPRLAVLQAKDRNYTFRAFDEINVGNFNSNLHEITYISDEIGSMTPEEVYYKFNAPGARPSDYYGHSLSMGDVLVYDRNGAFSAIYVDKGFGFVDLPNDFLTQEVKQKIRMGLDVRQERDLLQRVVGFVSEQRVPVDMSQEIERTEEISREFEGSFRLADLRQANEENQAQLAIIFDRQEKSGRDYGVIYDTGMYYATRMEEDRRVLMADTAEDYRQGIENLLERSKRESGERDVAIESTDDYADTTFHADLINPDVQNPDGTYGQEKNYYRIVTQGDDGRISPYDDRVFNSYEEAQSAIRENETLFLVDYDTLIHRAINHIEQEKMTSFFTAYDGNAYRTIDEWEERYGEVSLACKVGHSHEDGEDYYLATVEGQDIGYREYEFDEPPTREEVIQSFADDEAMREIDRREAEVDPTIFINMDMQRQNEQQHVYYSLRRPVSIGTYPRDGMLSFENYDTRTYVPEIGQEAWGKILYSRELTEQEIRDYEFASEKKGVVPIQEFFGNDGKILVGSDIGLDPATHFVDRRRVYEAVKDFETNNRDMIPYPVIGEDGDYTDRDFLYSGYDEYIGMSHREDTALDPYREAIETAVQKERTPRSEEMVRDIYTAEAYYAYRNGLSPEQIAYMITRSAEGQESPLYFSVQEEMRNIRRAFELGMTMEQVDVSLGQESFVQSTILNYLYSSGDMERARAMRGADMDTVFYLEQAYRDNKLSAEKAASVVTAINSIKQAAQESGFFNAVSHEMNVATLVSYATNRNITPEAIAKIAADFNGQSTELNIEDFVENTAEGIEKYYPHREEMERSKPTMANEQDKMTAPEGVALPEEKKTAKEELSEQLMQGVRSIMESENYRNWLATSNSYFTNSYSLNNAVLIFCQKPDATYVKSYEAWKEFGRNVAQGARGAQIFVPVMAYDKTEGALYRMIMSNLREQVKQNPGQIATYRVGMSQLEFTMNSKEQVGLRVKGQERGIFPTQQEMKKFITSSILGKVPMYYTVGRVFDIKDTIVPEYLWVKKGYTKDEVVKDKNGKPIKNRRGEVKIVNTPERQARFNPSLDLSVSDKKDPAKMAILYDVLKTVSARNGVPVSDVPRDGDDTLKGGADGYFSRRFTPENPKGYIVMPDDLEPTKRVSVLMHEMGHSDLHGNLDRLAAQMGEDKISRHMREIQAESVAFAVARQFGIETDTSSFVYLAEYSQGFELQDLKKSLDVIYNECRKLTQEINAELDARGLNLDLTEKESVPMEKETVDTLCKQYTAYALEQSEAVDSQRKELPSIAADNRNNPALLGVITEQSKCMDRQMKAVEAIHADVKALQGATSREEQNAALERLEALRRNVESEKSTFSDLVVSFAEISSQSKATIKEEFSRDPVAALESMKKDYPALQSMSAVQLAYMAKSEYIKREYGNLLKSDPAQFVTQAVSRAEALDKAIAKNGTFVEVNFCEQWTDKPIVKGGAIMHPKVADTIIKQAEVQIRGLKSEAEKMGEYFPYNKCDLTVFAKDGKDLTAYRTRVDIGDGAQTSLSDHLKQLCGEESNLVMSFDKATREKGAKEKIIFNAAPEVTAPDKENEGIMETPDTSTREEWANAIEQEKGGNQSHEQGSLDPEKTNKKDNMEH